TGTYTFGPYPEGTEAIITATNNEAPGCSVQSDPLAMETCPQVTIFCEDDPFSHSYCYEGGETISYTYVASDPSAVLNLRVDSGQIHPSSIAFPDSKFNVYDSDGSLLYSGNGDNGDLSG